MTKDAVKEVHDLMSKVSTVKHLVIKGSDLHYTPNAAKLVSFLFT